MPRIEKAIKAYGKGMGQKKKLIYRTDVDKLNSEALNELEGENEEVVDAIEKKIKN